jgi:hypothetical protein
MWRARSSQRGASAGDVAGTEQREVLTSRCGVASICDPGRQDVRRDINRRRIRRRAPRWRCGDRGGTRVCEEPEGAARSQASRCASCVQRCCRSRPWGGVESALHVGRREGGARQHQRDASQHTPPGCVRQTWTASPQIRIGISRDCSADRPVVQRLACEPPAAAGTTLQWTKHGEWLLSAVVRGAVSPSTNRYCDCRHVQQATKGREQWDSFSFLKVAVSSVMRRRPT